MATIAARVADWLERAGPGRFMLRDLWAAFPDLNQQSIQKTISTLLPRRGYDIVPVLRGHSYEYRGHMPVVPLPRPQHGTPLLFQQIATGRDGAVVLQSEHGVVYIARPVE